MSRKDGIADIKIEKMMTDIGSYGSVTHVTSTLCIPLTFPSDFGQHNTVLILYFIAMLPEVKIIKSLWNHGVHQYLARILTRKNIGTKVQTFKSTLYSTR